MTQTGNRKATAHSCIEIWCIILVYYSKHLLFYRLSRGAASRAEMSLGSHKVGPAVILSLQPMVLVVEGTTVSGCQLAVVLPSF